MCVYLGWTLASHENVGAEPWTGPGWEGLTEFQEADSGGRGGEPALRRSRAPGGPGRGTARRAGKRRLQQTARQGPEREAQHPPREARLSAQTCPEKTNTKPRMEAALGRCVHRALRAQLHVVTRTFSSGHAPGQILCSVSGSPGTWTVSNTSEPNPNVFA